MDKQEALELLNGALSEYERLSYADVAAKVGNDEYLEVVGPSGAEYQIEVQFLWDHKPDGDIRALGGIDDGTFRAAFRPLCRDFVMRNA